MTKEDDDKSVQIVDVATHLESRGGTQTPVSFEDKTRVWFAKESKKLKALCGGEEDFRRITIAALNSLNKTPSLAETTFESFTTALLTCAELRLMPGAAQECAIVPFNNSKKNCKEATFMIMYQGLCQMLYRSGMIMDIECEVVCDKDKFDYVRGTSRHLVFEPAEGEYSDRGDWKGAYCLIRNKFGGTHIVYMTKGEIEGIKDRSRASKSYDSPWNSKNLSDLAWMWKKTALKQCAKLCPKSAQVAQILNELE